MFKRPCQQPGMYPRWVEGGFLAFLQLDGTLFAVRFDSRRLRFAGAPVPITDRVRIGPAFPGKLGISRTGTVAYLGGEVGLRELVQTDRNGKVTVLPVPERIYFRPRFSPDGRRIAFQVLDFASRSTSDVWVYDTQGNTASRITFDSSASNAAWLPDGRHLVYVGKDGVIFRIATDGSGVAESLLAHPPSVLLPEVESGPDGRILVFREIALGTGRDIYVASRDTAWTIRPLLRTPFDERGIALSPDGKWLAYLSNETGSDEVFVRRLEEGSGHWRVSRNGGSEPRWGPGGRELFYRAADTVLSVTVGPGPEPTFSAPHAVLTGVFSADRNNASWDVSPDGKRVVFSRTKGAEGTLTMNVILHWFDRLRAAPRVGSR